VSKTKIFQLYRKACSKNLRIGPGGGHSAIGMKHPNIATRVLRNLFFRGSDNTADRIRVISQAKPRNDCVVGPVRIEELEVIIVSVGIQASDSPSGMNREHHPVDHRGIRHPLWPVRGQQTWLQIHHTSRLIGTAVGAVRMQTNRIKTSWSVSQIARVPC